jgi:peptide/nickel transport system permease protein/peptide/nickel transport system substrate-binding protein
MADRKPSGGNFSENLIVNRRQLLATGAGLGLAGLFLPKDVFAQETPKKGGKLTVVFPINPSTLDPYTGFTASELTVLAALYDRLVDVDPHTLEARPGLAKSWDISNPNEIVLDLQENVKFHDGTPCDAEAVKFNLERGKNHPRSVVKADLGAIQSMEVKSPTRLVLKLSKPDSALILMFAERAGMISSPKALQDLGDKYGREAIGSGPWKLVRWVDNDVVEFVRNENYWQKGLPYLDAINFRIIPETNTGLRAVVAGEADVVLRLAGPQITSAQKASNLTTVVAPTLGSLYVYLNFGRPPFDNVKVRQALNYSIDREVFNQIAFNGLSKPAWTLLAPELWAHDQSLTNTYPYNPEKSLALLKEAGHTRVKFTISGPSDQASRQRLEILADQIKKGGFDPQIQLAPMVEASAAFFGQKVDALWSRWTGRPDPSQAFYVNFSEQGVTNPSKTPPPPELLEAMEASRAVNDTAARKKALAKVERLVNDLALGVPVVYEPEVDALGKRVQGYEPNLLGKPFFNKTWVKDG